LRGGKGRGGKCVSFSPFTYYILLLPRRRKKGKGKGGNYGEGGGEWGAGFLMS